MRILFLLCATYAIVAVSCSRHQEGTYIIRGSVEGFSEGYAYFQKTLDGQLFVFDTAKISEGKFEFTGKVELPEMMQIRIDSLPDLISFFAENSLIQIATSADSLKSAKISGSVSNDIFTRYKNESLRFDEEDEVLYQKYREAKENGNQEMVDKIIAQSDSLGKLKGEFTRSFIELNKASVVAPYLVLRQLIYELNAEGLNQFLAQFDSSIYKSVYVEKIKERASLLEQLAPGKPAPNFTQNDVNGKPISLSSFKGKVVFVDFWASWCSPCRAINPKIVELYGKFKKNKDFAILGVSLDKDVEAWKKAIADDKLTWNHVSDLQGWKNAAAKLYGIMSIPHNILIDKDGNIAADNLSPEELEVKIAELLK